MLKGIFDVIKNILSSFITALNFIVSRIGKSKMFADNMFYLHFKCDKKRREMNQWNTKKIAR